MRLPNLGNAMFLSDDLQAYVGHIREANAPFCGFARRLNELANRSLFCCSVHSNVLQELLLVTLLQRAMTSFQAVVLLVERGLPLEAQGSIRTLLEATFKIVAIAKHPTVGVAFVQDDELHREKFLGKFKKLNPDMDADARAELESLHEAIKKNNHASELKELKTYWFAEKADMLGWYNSLYAISSNTLHVGLRTLEDTLNVDKSGKVVSLNYRFSDENLALHVVSACDCLITALRSAASVLDFETNDEICSIADQFQVLCDSHKEVIQQD